MAISCCPRSADKTLRFEIVDDLPETELQAMVKVTEAPDGIEVDTGPLSFFIPNAGFLPICDVRLGGVRLWGKAPFKGFTVRCDGQDVGSASGPVELEIEEAGPLRAVLLMTGKHRLPDGSGYLDLHGRITAYAGKPYMRSSISSSMLRRNRSLHWKRSNLLSRRKQMASRTWRWGKATTAHRFKSLMARRW